MIADILFSPIRLDELETLVQNAVNKALSKIAEKSEFQSDELLTIAQAAALLRLTSPTIYGLIHKKSIPHSKKGKRLYFSKLELLEWVKSGRKKTIAESQANPESHLRTPKRRATA